MTRQPAVIVVGGGTAGCTVAAALANRGIDVHLLEAGTRPEQQESRDFFRALHSPHAVSNRVVSTSVDVASRAYTQASVLGGGSSVNAMVSLPGDPRDYDEWSTTENCSGWSWSDVEPTFAALSIRNYFPTTPEQGTFGSLFLGAVENSEVAPLAWGSRRLSAETLLHSLDTNVGQVNVRTRCTASRLLAENETVVGVELSDGTNLIADAVVLCAGALATPKLLRTLPGRDGNGVNSNVGEFLQDHPAVMFTCESSMSETAGFVVTAIATLHDDLGSAVGQLMTYNHVGDGSSRVGIGVSLLDVHSRGRINEEDYVSFNMLSDERDIANMRRVLRWATTQIATNRLASLGTWLADDIGTKCDDLAHATDSDIDKWLRLNVGFQSHASGSCRMGPTPRSSVVSTSGRVHGLSDAWIADASVFPRIPRANTNMPVMMVATRIAQSIAESL